jgi:hypothetical protein
MSAKSVSPNSSQYSSAKTLEEATPKVDVTKSDPYDTPTTIKATNLIKKPANSPSYADFVKGTLAVAGMVGIWVLQVELIKLMSNKMDYRKPFFQRLLGQSFLILCFPFAYCYNYMQKSTHGNYFVVQGSLREQWNMKWKPLFWAAAVFTTGYHIMGYLWYHLI